MSSHKRASAVSGDIADSTTPKYRSGRPVFVRYAAQHLGLLAALSITGFIVGIAYRSLIDDPSERDLANYVRSGMHGVGIALAGWTVQAGFASTTRSPFGVALRRLPVAGEVVVRSLVMTAALTIAAVSLQLVLYAKPLQLRWINISWFTTTLPRIIAIGFAISLVAGVITETGRLIGGPMLISVVLGTYHRPAREQRIVMFLDLANSTRLAEEMGELRVHDLITRFFFDIDEPICEHGGAVHAYVGDEVIVTWPVTGDAACDARCVACFFAIERKMSRLAVDYDREFEVVPRFRAGLHQNVPACG